MGKQNFVGIDLGQSSIKIASVIKGKDKGYVIKNSKSYPVAEDIYSDGYFTLMKNSLASFISEFSIKKPLVSVSCAERENWVTTGIIDYPQVATDVKKKEIDKTIKFELEDKLIFDGIDSYYYRWQRYKSKENEDKILIGAVKKIIIEKIKESVEQKYKLVKINIQTLSFSSLVSGNVAVIDFGHEETRVFGYSNGQLISKQSFVEGSPKSITKKISDELSYMLDGGDPLVSAEKMKREKGEVLFGIEELSSSYETKEIFNVISYPIMALVESVKQMIRSVEVNDGLLIDTVYFTGDGARLKYLVDYAQRELSLTFSPVELTEVSFDEINQIGSENEYSYTYMPAISPVIDGEVIYEDMNFALEKVELVAIKEILAFGLSLLVALHGGAFMYSRNINSKLSEVESLNQQISTERVQVENEVMILMSEIRSIESLENKIKAITTSERNTSDPLWEIPQNTPAGISVTSMLVDGDTAIISGCARDYTAVGLFSMGMENIADIEILKIEDNDVSVFRDGEELKKKFVLKLLPYSIDLEKGRWSSDMQGEDYE